MKYISLDIETTGLDPWVNDTLEFGAYLEDTANPMPREQLPFFHCYIWKEQYTCNAVAAAMNKRIFEKIAELKAIQTNCAKGQDVSTEKLEEANRLLLNPEDVAAKFYLWLKANGLEKVIPAGKNVASFDIPFLKQLDGFEKIRFHHRALDPVTLYFDPLTDDMLPDLATCKKRANLEELVTHEALDDSWDVIRLLRFKFQK